MLDNYAMQVSHRQWWKTCQKWKAGPKTIFFSRRLQVVRNRDFWVFWNHWRGV